MNAEAVRSLALRLGLPRTVVWTLVNAGWTYVEDVNCEPKWVRR